MDIKPLYSCDTCGQLFNKKSEYIVHQKKSHQIECDACDDLFSTSFQLNRHWEIKHKEQWKRCGDCEVYHLVQNLIYHHNCREETLGEPEKKKIKKEEGLVDRGEKNLEPQAPLPILQAPAPPTRLTILPDDPYLQQVLVENQYLIADKTKPYLGLENFGEYGLDGPLTKSTDCFMNCISQLLYSVPDLHENLKKHLAIKEIFEKEYPSAKKWRRMLESEFHHDYKDLHTVFDAMLKDFHSLQIDLSPIQSRYTNVNRCSCRGAPRQELRSYSVLTIKNSSFKTSLENTFSFEPKKCTRCQEEWFKWKIVEPLGDYHLMQVHFMTRAEKDDQKENQEPVVFIDLDDEVAVVPSRPIEPPKKPRTPEPPKKYITDLDWTSTVFMFGSCWQIRSMGVHSIKGDGHFTAYVRVGDKFVHIDDDKVSEEVPATLEDLNVKFIVFEKIHGIRSTLVPF